MLAENVLFNDYYSAKASVLLQKKTHFLRVLLDKPKNCQKITMYKVVLLSP